MLPLFLTGHSKQRSFCLSACPAATVYRSPQCSELYKLYPSLSHSTKVSWAPILLPRKLWLREVKCPAQGGSQSKQALNLGSIPSLLGPKPTPFLPQTLSLPWASFSELRSGMRSSPALAWVEGEGQTHAVSGEFAPGRAAGRAAGRRGLLGGGRDWMGQSCWGPGWRALGAAGTGCRRQSYGAHGGWGLRGTAQGILASASGHVAGHRHPASEPGASMRHRSGLALS